MPLPSRIAFSMVAKLSSVSTRSAAFLATSVPSFPIAIPTSAAFRDGASLIPSPVIATVFPFFFRASTILTLCSGETLANTRMPSTFLRNSSSGIASISPPVMHSLLSPAIPSSPAIARAVSTWSPVIITVSTCALQKLFTASAASGLGGSIIPTSPRNIRFFSSVRFPFCFIAMVSTRRACPAIPAAASFASRFARAEKGISFPCIKQLWHRSIISSEAPLMYATFSVPFRCTVVILFRSESKALSSIRG